MFEGSVLAVVILGSQRQKGLDRTPVNEVFLQKADAIWD